MADESDTPFATATPLVADDAAPAQPVVVEPLPAEPAASLAAPAAEVAPKPKRVAKPRKTATDLPAAEPEVTVPVAVASPEPAPTVTAPLARTRAPVKRATPVAATRIKRQPASAAPKPLRKNATTPSIKPSAQPKETIMSSFDFSTLFTSAFTDLQEKAKAAYEKSTSALGDYSDFAKGNVEAIVESGKILASGLQELSTGAVSESRSAFESLTAEVKELAAAKSPTDFMKLQSDLMRKHFDTAVAYSSKHSEAMLKLANEVASPISSRVSLAVEKVKAAA